MKKLSIIIPVFNEEKTVIESLSRVIDSGIFDEVVIVDDCSRDNSYKIIKDFIEDDKRFNLIQTPKNIGKGGAVNFGKDYIKFDFVVIHDADLEYFPSDLGLLLEKVDSETMVIGSRFLGNLKRLNKYKSTYFANKFFSKLFSLFYKVKVTDIATCYKMMPTEFFKNTKFLSTGFDYEIEVVAKFLRYSKKIIEVPINYQGRSYKEGKKIKAYDGIKYIFAMIMYRYESNSSNNSNI